MQYPHISGNRASSSRIPFPRETRVISDASSKDLDIALKPALTPPTSPPTSPPTRPLSLHDDDFAPFAAQTAGHGAAAQLRVRRGSSPRMANVGLFRSSRSQTPEVVAAPSPLLVADIEMPRSRLLISKSECCSYLLSRVS